MRWSQQQQQHPANLSCRSTPSCLLLLLLLLLPLLCAVYAAQAQELATEYMGHANVYLDQATEYVTTTLDKLGIKPARKTEL
jgi:uncharacterized membrane protein